MSSHVWSLKVNSLELEEALKHIRTLKEGELNWALTEDKKLQLTAQSFIGVVQMTLDATETSGSATFAPMCVEDLTLPSLSRGSAGASTVVSFDGKEVLLAQEHSRFPLPVLEGKQHALHVPELEEVGTVVAKPFFTTFERTARLVSTADKDQYRNLFFNFSKDDEIEVLATNSHILHNAGIPFVPDPGLVDAGMTIMPAVSTELLRSFKQVTGELTLMRSKDKTLFGFTQDGFVALARLSDDELVNVVKSIHQVLKAAEETPAVATMRCSTKALKDAITGISVFTKGIGDIALEAKLDGIRVVANNQLSPSNNVPEELVRAVKLDGVDEHAGPLINHKETMRFFDFVDTEQMCLEYASVLDKPNGVKWFLVYPVVVQEDEEGNPTYVPKRERAAIVVSR